MQETKGSRLISSDVARRKILVGIFRKFQLDCEAFHCSLTIFRCSIEVSELISWLFSVPPPHHQFFWETSENIITNRYNDIRI